MSALVEVGGAIFMGVLAAAVLWAGIGPLVVPESFVFHPWYRRAMNMSNGSPAEFARGQAARYLALGLMLAGTSLGLAGLAVGRAIPAVRTCSSALVVVLFALGAVFALWRSEIAATGKPRWLVLPTVRDMTRDEIDAWFEPPWMDLARGEAAAAAGPVETTGTSPGDPR